jgi:hypothetical protein
MGNNRLIKAAIAELTKRILTPAIHHPRGRKAAGEEVTCCDIEERQPSSNLGRCIAATSRTDAELSNPVASPA